jgi:hypothetical protein
MSPAPSPVKQLKRELASGQVVVVGSGVAVAACGQQLVEGHKIPASLMPAARREAMRLGSRSGGPCGRRPSAAAKPR